MTYFLDTDTCIGILRQRPGMVARLQSTSPNECAVSTITIYELTSGVAGARDPQKERAKIETFAKMVVELPFDRKAAEVAGTIRSDLEAIGQVIGPYDLLLAGHCLSLGLTFVTNNVREFSRVQNLNIQSWP
jgi:tRNA(fMet)-specific endonuclease VapC